MAEGLLKHALGFSLNTWLAAANNALLPPLGTPVHFDPTPPGYALQYKIRSFDVVATLTRDFSLQKLADKHSDDSRQEFAFHPGPQGLVLTSWTMGEDGRFTPGNRLIFTYTYQNSRGFQIPDHLTVTRESHHETWRFQLTDCKVQRAKS